MNRGGSSSRRPSAAMEKKRREQMKDLYSKLASLLHLQPYERMPLLDFVDLATNSLKQRKERVERLKLRKKEDLENQCRGELTRERNSQIVQVTEMNLTLEAILVIATNNKKVELSQILNIIEDGGTEITSSSFSTVGNHIYYTVYAKALQSRVGFDASLIESRLMQLVFEPRGILYNGT